MHGALRGGFLATVGLVISTIPIGASTVSAATVDLGCPATVNAGVATCTFSFTGAAQTWTVPTGVTSIQATLVGGAGGVSASDLFPTQHRAGGKGAQLGVTMPVTPGETLQVNVGGGAPGHGRDVGGWNGGGGSGFFGGVPNLAGGGGGASDIRRGAFALADRVVVAGGGGGGGGNALINDPVTEVGGAGGDAGSAGAASTGIASAGGGQPGTASAGGAGGTAVTIPLDYFALGTPAPGAAGSLGQGGAVTAFDGGEGGGGGGGYYGGGSGASGLLLDSLVGADTTSTAAGGGGGGSSYAAPALTVTQPPTAVGTGNGSIVVTFADPRTPPTIGGIDDQPVGTDGGACTATNVPAPSVTLGGIPTPTVSYSPSLAGPFPVGSTSVTATASNGVVPDATATFHVVVSDNQAPLVTVPAPFVVSTTNPAGTTVDYTLPLVRDNCPGAALLLVSGPARGAVFPIGRTPVTYAGTDTAGHRVEITYTVTVNLTGAAPTISGLPPVVTVPAAPGVCAVTNVAPPAFTLGGTPTPSVSFAPALAGTFPVGNTPVTLTASNGFPPDATASFSLQVTDGQKPSVPATSNISVPATGSSGAIVTYTTPAPSDNCPGVQLSRTVGKASGAMFPIGDTTVRFTATDASNNTTSTSFIVHVSGAAEQLTTLIAAVSGTTPGKALKDKLLEVQRALSKGKTRDAREELKDFVELVRAQSGKKLTKVQADAFIAAAQRIIAVLK